MFSVPGDSLFFPRTACFSTSVRISVTGLTTPGTMVWNSDQFGGRGASRPFRGAAAAALEAMHRDADVTVALVHSGLGGRASSDTTGVGDEDAAAALANLPGRPDVVVVGHSHRDCATR